MLGVAVDANHTKVGSSGTHVVGLFALPPHFAEGDLYIAAEDTGGATGDVVQAE